MRKIRGSLSVIVILACLNNSSSLAQVAGSNTLIDLIVRGYGDDTRKSAGWQMAFGTKPNDVCILYFTAQKTDNLLEKSWDGKIVQSPNNYRSMTREVDLHLLRSGTIKFDEKGNSLRVELGNYLGVFNSPGSNFVKLFVTYPNGKTSPTSIGNDNSILSRYFAASSTGFTFETHTSNKGQLVSALKDILARCSAGSGVTAPSSVPSVTSAPEEAPLRPLDYYPVNGKMFACKSDRIVDELTTISMEIMEKALVGASPAKILKKEFDRLLKSDCAAYNSGSVRGRIAVRSTENPGSCTIFTEQSHTLFWSECPAARLWSAVSPLFESGRRYQPFQ